MFYRSISFYSVNSACNPHESLVGAIFGLQHTVWNLWLCSTGIISWHSHCITTFSINNKPLNIYEFLFQNIKKNTAFGINNKAGNKLRLKMRLTAIVLVLLAYWLWIEAWLTSAILFWIGVPVRRSLLRHLKPRRSFHLTLRNIKYGIHFTHTATLYGNQSRYTL